MRPAEEGLGRHPPDLGNPGGGGGNHAGIAAFAAIGHRRHIGRVGFEQQGIQGNGSGHLHRPSGVFEGDGAAETDEKPPPDHLIRHLHAP